MGGVFQIAALAQILDSLISQCYHCPCPPARDLPGIRPRSINTPSLRHRPKDSGTHGLTDARRTKDQKPRPKTQGQRPQDPRARDPRTSAQHKPEPKHPPKYKYKNKTKNSLPLLHKNL